MKQKVLNVVKPIVFLVIGVMLFSLIQQIFIPDESRKREHADRTIDGLGKIAQGTVDVIFIGPSYTEYGFSPVRLYEETGICSYSLATSGQPIGVAYWLLKDALTKQKPSMIFLQAQLFEVPDVDRSTAKWSYILDNYPLSPFKFEMAKDYETVPYGTGMMSALFPIIKYHTRWCSLTASDFDLRNGGEYYSLGEWINGMVVSGYTTYESIDQMVDFLKQDTYITAQTNGNLQRNPLSTQYVSPQITDYAKQSFLRIKELCDENNVELVLYQIPRIIYPQYGGGYEWTREMSNQVRELAQTYDLKFYDLQYDTDIGLNWITDTCDANAHLNIRGAEKVSDAIGKYLLNNFSVRQQSNPQYDGYAAKYDKVRDVAMLQSEIDLQEYLNRISEKRNQWSVFISASDEYTAGMKPEVYDKFENLGLPLIREGKFRDAYVGVLDRGEAKYEAVSGRRIDYSADLNGTALYLSSTGWYAGADCAIILNGRNYVIGGRGLNIVVFDNESGLVIDSVRFDTSSVENTAYHNNAFSIEFLSNYEQKMCF